MYVRASSSKCCTTAGAAAYVCVAVALAITYSCASVSAEQQPLRLKSGQVAETEESPLRSLLTLERQLNWKRHEQEAAAEQREAAAAAAVAQRQQAKQKLELKRRLHKLIDELVDTRLEDQQQTSGNQKQQAPKGGASSSSGASQAKLQAQMKSKRKSHDSSLSLIKKSNNYLDSVNDNDNQRIVIIVSKPALDSADQQAADKQAVGLAGNSISEQFNLADNLSEAPPPPPPSQSRQPTRRPLTALEMREHERKVAADQFGILRESLFSSNNHLGLKGVPKLGSEDEY